MLLVVVDLAVPNLVVVLLLAALVLVLHSMVAMALDQALVVEEVTTAVAVVATLDLAVVAEDLDILEVLTMAPRLEVAMEAMLHRLVTPIGDLTSDVVDPVGVAVVAG